MFNNAAVRGRKVEMARVLIVDSHSAIREWLNASLGKIGHEVDQATSGKTALETASREPIDLMLVDVDLPGMDGYQVLSNLKGNPQTRAIPVIMLTSIPSYEMESSCLRLGASIVLTKPCSFEELGVHIRVALREGQQSGEKRPDVAATPIEAEWELASVILIICFLMDTPYAFSCNFHTANKLSSSGRDSILILFPDNLLIRISE